MVESQEVRRLRLERLRRLSDPVRNFVPNDVQEPYLRSLARCRAINGVNRTGKTAVACVEIAYLLRGTHPYRTRMDAPKGIVLVPRRKQASGIWGPKLLEASGLIGPGEKYPILPPKEVDVAWDRQRIPWAPSIITHKRTGAQCHFAWSAAASAQLAEEGFEWDFVYFDESAGTVRLYEEMMTRLLDSTAKYAKKGEVGGWFSWMATETKINEAYDRFIATCRDPDEPDFELFTAKEEDNAKVIPTEIRKKGLAGLSEGARKIRGEGVMGARDLVLVYPQFAMEADRFMLKEPWQCTKKDNIIAVLDPGGESPMGLGFFHLAADDPRVLHWKHFLWGPNIGIDQVATHIRTYLDGRRMLLVIYDKHGDKHERGGGARYTSRLASFLDDEGLWVHGSPTFRRVKQNHGTGIAAVKTYLDPHPNVHDGPLLTMDPDNGHNGMARALRQLAGYRGREDLDYEGYYGVIKKADEAPDILRYAVMRSLEWADYGENLPKGVLDIKAYEQADPDQVPELTEKEKENRRARERGQRVFQEWQARQKKAPRRRTLRM